MQDINFHKPYEGRKDNRYTYNIQVLYRYQSLLQEITKELHKILKENPEYRNKNNTFIKNYINKITDSANVRGANLMKIIENIEKPKNITTYVSNLCKVRKIYLEEISILEQYINTLDLPQNNNNENNNENYPNFQVSKPKQKERLANMQKIKDSRTQKGIERENSKSLREANLGRSTIRRDINQMQKEIKNEFSYVQDRRAYIESLKNQNRSMGIKMPNSYYESEYFPSYQ